MKNLRIERFSPLAGSLYQRYQGKGGQVQNTWHNLANKLGKNKNAVQVPEFSHPVEPLKKREPQASARVLNSIFCCGIIQDKSSLAQALPPVPAPQGL